MLDQWTLFQYNLGIWQGSFTTFNQQLQLQHVQPSELTLALAPSGVSIELSLLFWSEQQQLFSQSEYTANVSDKLVFKYDNTHDVCTLQVLLLSSSSICMAWAVSFGFSRISP